MCTSSPESRVFSLILFEQFFQPGSEIYSIYSTVVVPRHLVGYLNGGLSPANLLLEVPVVETRNEPPHEKTNNVVFEQVQQKQPVQ